MTSDIKEIVVPVDFSPTSDRALDYAVDFAKKVGARLTLVHAYELPVYGFPDGALVASAEVAGRILSSAQAGLLAAIEKRKDSGVEMRSILRDGPPAEEVAAVAKQVHADMVILGTHGRTGLRRAIMGSVAEEVIRACECPVLAIHDPVPASKK